MSKGIPAPVLAAILAVLCTSPAHAYGHYPARDSAPAYFDSPCSHAIQFVIDRAQVFSDAFGPAVEDLACSLAQNYSAELVVATVARVRQDSLPAYAEGLFQNWNVGGIREIGVLLLYTPEYGSTGQASVWIHIGRGLSTGLGDQARSAALEEIRTGFDRNIRRGLSENAAVEIGLARGAASLADAIAAAYSEDGFPPPTHRPLGQGTFWLSTALFLLLLGAMGTGAIWLDMRMKRN